MDSSQERIPSRYLGDRKKIEQWRRLQASRARTRELISAHPNEADRSRGLPVRRRDSGELLLLKLAPSVPRPPHYEAGAKVEYLPLRFSAPEKQSRNIRIPVKKGEAIIFETSTALASADGRVLEPAVYVRPTSPGEAEIIERTGTYFDFRGYLEPDTLSALTGREIEGVIAASPESEEFYLSGVAQEAARRKAAETG